MSNYFHFDTYCCTFPDEMTVQDICRGLNFIAAPEETFPRQRGYRKAIAFGDLAWLMHDPATGSYGCHLKIAGGDSCAPIVDEVRLRLPDHRVTRADVAADFDYPGAWSDIEALALGVAKNHLPEPLSVDVMGKHYMPEQGGRTTVVGSRTSTHYLRVYEKGHEQRAKGLQPEASLDWVRAEIEVKPSKKGDKRLLASRMSPDEFAHSSPWCADFSARLGATCGAAVSLSTTRTVSAFHSAFGHMLKQYGPTMRKAEKSGEATRGEMLAIIAREVFRDESIAQRIEAMTVKKKRRSSSAMTETERRAFNFAQYWTEDGIIESDIAAAQRAGKRTETPEGATRRVGRPPKG